jgi:hypothetical protein
MMTRGIQMTANNHFLHIQVGAGLPIGTIEEGPIRNKAIRFYWDIYQLLYKDGAPLPEHDRSRVFRLSFEDDFGEDLEGDFYQDDYSDDDVFLPGENLLKEDGDSLDEEEENRTGFRNELFYK